METWWASLELFQKVMWSIAIVTSVIFIIQMVMTFLGMDSDGGMDGDFDSDGDFDGSMPFQLFTFRNLINFLLGFSWTGISLYNTISNKFLLVMVAAFVGCVLVAIVIAIFFWMSKATQSGNININDTKGLTATVYFPIPAKRSRAGKVQINVQGAVREYDAMTEGDETIPTGQLVRVVQVIDGGILLVEKV